ncbi:MAG TPA: sensor histidine kinase [Spirochaetota bacterium]|nr:sensor histidine kinase [Spirochaetota bacterium]HQF08173.1 sensor histidine kinase [Spirochaetota bacterium]HQH96940.1 sensor histidine kinase [Spirochaetota bacterium]
MKDRSIVIGEYSAFIITIAGEKHIMVTIVDITERKCAEERIRALLAEKELLLREVNHRLKNNMNTMISLLSLQAGTLNEQATINALLKARGRIQSMSVLYDTLYQTENVGEMSIEHYLTPLVERIVPLFPISTAVTIDMRIENFPVKVKTLLPLGIIANELVTNAMKYAFTGREKGTITVSALKEGSHAAMVIEDDGIGIPETVNPEQPTGFGLKLVGILVKQIGGAIMTGRPGGARFMITFPLPS